MDIGQPTNRSLGYYAIDSILVEATGDEVHLHEIEMAKPRAGLLGGLLGGDVFCVVSDLVGDENGDIDRLADLLNDILGN